MPAGSARTILRVVAARGCCQPTRGPPASVQHKHHGDEHVLPGVDHAESALFEPTQASPGMDMGCARTPSLSVTP